MFNRISDSYTFSFFFLPNLSFIFIHDTDVLTGKQLITNKSSTSQYTEINCTSFMILSIVRNLLNFHFIRRTDGNVALYFRLLKYSKALVTCHSDLFFFLCMCRVLSVVSISCPLYKYIFECPLQLDHVIETDANIEYISINIICCAM